MADFAAALGASKAASTLLVLFIPSRDRNDRAIDQAHWVDEALNALGTLFGGATAFPQGKRRLAGRRPEREAAFR